MRGTIYFDMDGTIANFYGVDGWLDYLICGDATPYAIAKPLINFSAFARQLHRLQKLGYEIGIVSWLAKNSTTDFDELVTETKKAWLKKHLPSVEWNEINIVSYGTPKSTVVKNANGILFDDEAPNRKEWARATDCGLAFNVENILEILASMK